MKPRVLLVEPQHDIDEVSQRISSLQGEHIALIIPRGSIILQSIICLKILRTNAEKEKKYIAIVTHDSQGRKFADRLGIPSAAHLDHLEKYLSEPSYSKYLEKNTPSQKTKEKKSFRKLHHITPKKEKSEKSSLYGEKRKRELLEVLSKPNKTILFLIGILSLCLFLFVATLAFPGATVKISPQKKIIDTTINVTLTTGDLENATDSWRQHVLPAEPIESIFEKTIPFETVTKVFTGENASGNITVINNTNEEIPLKPRTQFQTKKGGIIFRTQDWIKLPPQGKVVVPVIADERDAQENFIGSRGNLEVGQELIVPNLPENYQQDIWGEVTEPLTGGVTNYYPMVSEEDLEIARNQITSTLTKDAERDLNAFVHRKNQLDGRDLFLIPGDEFLHTEVLSVEFPEDILGQQVEDFEVHARMKVRAITFSKGEMLSVLRGALLSSVDPGMELSSVENTIIPEVISVSPNQDRVKVTVSVRGAESYIIEPRTVSGVKFVNQVKEEIQGKNITEAQKILENFHEVSDVKIDVWPPFIQTVPSLPENISVQLME